MWVNESPGSWWWQQTEMSEAVAPDSVHQPHSLLRTVLDPNLKPQWAWPAQREPVFGSLCGLCLCLEWSLPGRLQRRTAPELPLPLPSPSPAVRLHSSSAIQQEAGHERERGGGARASLCGVTHLSTGNFWGLSSCPVLLFPSFSISAPPLQPRGAGLREGSSWTEITQQGEMTH